MATSEKLARSYELALLLFCDKGEDGPAVQSSKEFGAFVRVLKEHECKAIIEIGTRRGGSAVLFGLAGLRVLTLDLDPNARCVERLAARYGVKDRVMWLHGDSTQTRAVDQALARIPKPDAVFIDGFHGLSWVRRDHELWNPIVPSGGIVAFHDICFHAEDCGVPEFWAALKRDNPNMELQEIHTVGGYGIGWFVKP